MNAPKKNFKTPLHSTCFACHCPALALPYEGHERQTDIAKPWRIKVKKRFCCSLRFTSFVVTRHPKEGLPLHTQNYFIFYDDGIHTTRQICV